MKYMTSMRQLLVIAMGILAVSILVVNAAESPPGIHEVKAVALSEDTSSGWTLDFRCKDPQFITVDIPKRGRKTYCYMWYQVSNPTAEPRTFFPDIELITLDDSKVYHDKSHLLPTVIEAIRHREDPQDKLNLKVSVTMYRTPIPPAKDGSPPVYVTGVAVWESVNPKCDRSIVFIKGLSNVLVSRDKNVLRVKTLQLTFKREGKAIAFSTEWWYRLWRKEG